MNLSRDFKGIWIPKELWLNQSLSPAEKCLLAEIDSLSRDGQECFASNEYLAEFMHMTEGSLKNMMTSLREKGHIIDVRFDGRRRYIRAEVIPGCRQGSLKSDPCRHPGMTIEYRGEQRVDSLSPIPPSATLQSADSPSSKPSPNPEGRGSAAANDENALQSTRTQHPCHDQEGTKVGPGRPNSARNGGKSAKRLSDAEELYQRYPRKAGKGAAIKAIFSALRKDSFETICTALVQYSAAVERWPKEEKKFIPYPATWFNQERWKDDQQTWVRDCKKSRQPDSGLGTTIRARILN